MQERPRERLKNYGVKNLSNEDLLTILIKTGTYNKSAKDISLNILKNVDSIIDLNNITLEELMKIDGIGLTKASTILSAIELGFRITKKIPIISELKVTNSEIVFNYYKDIIGNEKQEYFYCLYLDNSKRIIKDKLLFIGTINQSIVHPREVFKEAYKLSACSIICVHNHPTNNVLPSKEDINLTKRLVDIGLIQGIPIIDHIIVGNSKYYSFYENNDIR